MCCSGQGAHERGCRRGSRRPAPRARSKTAAPEREHAEVIKEGIRRAEERHFAAPVGDTDRVERRGEAGRERKDCQFAERRHVVGAFIPGGGGFLLLRLSSSIAPRKLSETSPHRAASRVARDATFLTRSLSEPLDACRSRGRLPHGGAARRDDCRFARTFVVRRRARRPHARSSPAASSPSATSSSRGVRACAPRHLARGSAGFRRGDATTWRVACEGLWNAGQAPRLPSADPRAARAPARARASQACSVSAT